MIALYPRVSTQEQATEGYSIEEQIDRLKKYCEAMGWNEYRIYTDAGYSGANTDRPALQEMIRDIKDGKIKRVVVYKLDRLSRSQKDTLELIEDVFLANDCEFEIISLAFISAFVIIFSSLSLTSDISIYPYEIYCKRFRKIFEIFCKKISRHLFDVRSYQGFDVTLLAVYFLQLLQYIRIRIPIKF